MEEKDTATLVQQRIDIHGSDDERKLLLTVIPTIDAARVFANMSDLEPVWADFTTIGEKLETHADFVMTDGRVICCKITMLYTTGSELIKDQEHYEKWKVSIDGNATHERSGQDMVQAGDKGCGEAGDI